MKRIGRRKHKRKHRRKPEPRLRVKPSLEIDARVAFEVAKAGEALRNLGSRDPLASPYLVSAIYYHDGFLQTFNSNQRDADPADRIVAQIAAGFASGTKKAFVDSLLARCAPALSEIGPGAFFSPVAFEPIPQGQPVHPFAIDLFLDEGSPVRSATRGIVVLAESGWMPDQWFSTSTVRGGNTVIIFDPDSLRFLRYAHLQAAQVKAGWDVEAGQIIGIVGHTGFNANRKGHGRHLHFEINEVVNGRVDPVPNEDLEALLEAASVRFPALFR